MPGRRGGGEWGLAAGPGRAAPPQDRGKRVPGHPLLPRTGVTMGHADGSLAEDIFQNPPPAPSFFSCPLRSGSCLLAVRDNRPSPPHPARLPAPRLRLPAKLSVNDRAPPPPASPHREQGHAGSGQSPRPGPPRAAGRDLPAPAARSPRRLSRALPVPRRAGPGLPRPGGEGLLNARPVYL